MWHLVVERKASTLDRRTTIEYANPPNAAGHSRTPYGAAHGMSNLATYICQPTDIDSRRAAVIRTRHTQEWVEGNPGEPDNEE